MHEIQTLKGGPNYFEVPLEYKFKKYMSFFSKVWFGHGIPKPLSSSITGNKNGRLDRKTKTEVI